MWLQQFFFWNFSVFGTKLFLTLAAVLMRAILVKIYLLLIQQTPENIPLQERTAPNGVNILQSKDKKKIKQLINNETTENTQLKKTLRFINLKGAKDVDERRSMNKTFMESLIDIQLGLPMSLIWLKRHLDFETSKAILSDWKIKG